LLQQTLDEEKAADRKLSALAESGINQSAADAAHPDEELEPVGAGSSRKGASSSRTGRRETIRDLRGAHTHEPARTRVRVCRTRRPLGTNVCAAINLSE
jgi:hypothetical protein